MGGQGDREEESMSGLLNVEAEAESECTRLRLEVTELTERLHRTQRVVGFFASVIKSGEGWSSECMDMLEQTKK